MNCKRKLLIYSDCYIYGGSERLMSFLIKNPLIQENYNITFAYRNHKIYQNGINKEFNDQEKGELLFPVSIISNSTLIYKINLTKFPVIFKLILKSILILIDITRIYSCYNIISHIITIKKILPDIIHINNGGYPGAKSCNSMVLAAKLLHIKHIVYQINNIAQKRTGLFDRQIDHFINKSISCFITASKLASDKLIKERKFQVTKIKQLPNTVIDESPTLSRVELLYDLSINPSDFILCTVGFLTKRKGQQFLLEALYQISQKQPEIFENIRLILVGDGEERQFLLDFVEKHKLVSNVFFIGYQSRSINYINACDVFVLPSIANEDMPLVVLSAMSKGKTIIATDFAGIREEIENGVSGILISPKIDTIAIDLANKIVELYKNRDYLFGEEANKRFNNLFSNQVYGQALINIYNSTLNEK